MTNERMQVNMRKDTVERLDFFKNKKYPDSYSRIVDMLVDFWEANNKNGVL